MLHLLVILVPVMVAMLIYVTLRYRRDLIIALLAYIAFKIMLWRNR